MAAETHSWNGKQLAGYLIAFVLAIGPFFNGMFFEPIRLVGAALAYVAYWLWYAGKAETDRRGTGLDVAVAAWFLSYVIASFTAILPRGHLSVLLDLVAFMAVYGVMRFSPRLEESLSRIVVASGVVMVIISVAQFCGVAWSGRLLVDLVIDDRLSGGFQYANSFAVWLFCLTLLALRHARTKRVGGLFLMIGGLFAGTFMLTLSRGAFIAAPVAYLVVVLLEARENRLFTTWATLLTWGPAFVLGTAAYRALHQEQRALGLAVLAACALPPLAAPYLAQFSEYLWSRKRRWGLAGAAVLLLGVLSVAPKAATVVVPALRQITDNRLTSGYALSDATIFPRLVYASDAWQIMAARHFVGAGGRAWTKLYLLMQSHPYFTTEVHNHYLQTGVEAGALGLLAFTAMLVLCLRSAWRARTRVRGDNALAIWAGLVTYIAVHSAYDFDLSYISLLLLLAVAAGVIAGHDTNEPAAGGRWLPPWRHGLVALTVLAFIAAGSLYVSKQALLASDLTWARGDIAGTIAKLQLAGRTDPLSAEPWQRMAALRAATGPAETRLPDAAVLWAGARARDGYDPAAMLELAGIAVQEKRWAQGIDLAMKADALMPLDQGVNGGVASVMWTAVAGALRTDPLTAVRPLADRLKAYELALTRRFDRATPYANYANAPFGFTPVAHLRLGQALVVSGDYAAAAVHLRRAVKSQAEKAEATQWLFVALDLGGNKQEAEKLRQDNRDLFTQFLESDLYRKVVAAAQAN